MKSLRRASCFAYFISTKLSYWLESQVFILLLVTFDIFQTALIYQIMLFSYLSKWFFEFRSVFGFTLQISPVSLFLFLCQQNYLMIRLTVSRHVVALLAKIVVLSGVRIDISSRQVCIGCVKQKVMNQIPDIRQPKRAVLPKELQMANLH